MTAAPHLAYLRTGLRFGSGTLLDHMADDGLRCAFECWGMGDAADYIADKYAVTREEQDRFALQSHQRAAAAIDAAHFAGEIVPLSAEQLGMREGCSVDEGVRYDSSPEALAKLRPAFSEHGTVTAGNSSQISDGAAALIVASAEKAAALDAQPLARIVDYYTAGVAPKEIFAAPISGIRTLLERNQLTVDDIDLFELNEAFAAQVLADIGEIGIPESTLNVTGGGVGPRTSHRRQRRTGADHAAAPDAAARRAPRRREPLPGRRQRRLYAGGALTEPRPRYGERPRATSCAAGGRVIQRRISRQ